MTLKWDFQAVQIGQGTKIHYCMHVTGTHETGEQNEEDFWDLTCGTHYKRGTMKETTFPLEAVNCKKCLQSKDWVEGRIEQTRINREKDQELEELGQPTDFEEPVKRLKDGEQPTKRFSFKLGEPVDNLQLPNTRASQIRVKVQTRPEYQDQEDLPIWSTLTIALDELLGGFTQESLNYIFNLIRDSYGVDKATEFYWQFADTTIPDYWHTERIPQNSDNIVFACGINSVTDVVSKVQFDHVDDISQEWIDGYFLRHVDVEEIFVYPSIRETPGDPNSDILVDWDKAPVIHSRPESVKEPVTVDSSTKDFIFEELRQNDQQLLITLAIDGLYSSLQRIHNSSDLDNALNPSLNPPEMQMAHRLAVKFGLELNWSNLSRSIWGLWSYFHNNREAFLELFDGYIVANWLERKLEQNDFMYTEGEYLDFFRESYPDIANSFEIRSLTTSKARAMSNKELFTLFDWLFGQQDFFETDEEQLLYDEAFLRDSLLWFKLICKREPMDFHSSTAVYEKANHILFFVNQTKAPTFGKKSIEIMRLFQGAGIYHALTFNEPEDKFELAFEPELEVEAFVEYASGELCQFYGYNIAQAYHRINRLTSLDGEQRQPVFLTIKPI